MLIGLVVLLTVISGVLGYGCWNLIKKNELLEDVINVYHAKTNATVRLMRHFDDRQIFESDDEVGEVFKLLLESVDDLYGYVTEIRDGTTQKTEE